MIRYEKIDVNLHVRSLEKTFEWYKEVLNWESGCDLKNENNECVFGDVHFSDSDEFLGFNLVRSDDEEIVPIGFHLLIKVPSEKLLNELYNQLKSKKIEIVSKLVIQSWGKNFKIKDCNGFILEFWCEI
ncbi:MAG: VOC family protein [Promethearchaeota archaeon]